MNARTYRRNTATQRNAALRRDRTEFVRSLALRLTNQHDFSHEIGINDDERSRGSAWLLLFVAGQQQSVQGRDCEGANIVYAETFDAIFPVAMTVPGNL